MFFFLFCVTTGIVHVYRKGVRHRPTRTVIFPENFNLYNNQTQTQTVTYIHLQSIGAHGLPGLSFTFFKGG
jgi:hypothetical protein